MNQQHSLRTGGAADDALEIDVSDEQLEAAIGHGSGGLEACKTNMGSPSCSGSPEE